MTAHNRRMTLTFAFNYGGRAEIVDAVQALVAEGDAGREDHGEGDPHAPLRPRHARPRPDRAHLGRAPHLQLPALGDGLQRAHLHRRRSGPTSAASTSSRPSASSSGATAASAGSTSSHAVGSPVMGLYRDEGIVLRTHKLGEADRIVSVLTRRHGKVRAVAKGVRKTEEPVRRPPRAAHPPAAPALRGARRAAHRRPGRDHRPLPGHPRRPRPPHPGRVDAGGGRPARPGGRAQPGALPDAPRRAAGARRPQRAARACRPSSSKVLSLEGFRPVRRPLRRVRQRGRPRRLRPRVGWHALRRAPRGRRHLRRGR